jgi:threonine synthase
MTTIQDDNIHCVSVIGTFDDCQDIVKKAFQDKSFRDEVKLGAVNSINWARVLAQTTYYFWSWLRITDGMDDPSTFKVSYSVPTGNFGDILAGYYSKRMGLPVGDLVVATNENDILHRFFKSGDYSRRNINESISPSMDICVSSNFERYLYHLFDDDPEKLGNLMKAFEDTGQLNLGKGATLARAQADFKSARCDTEMTLAIIKEYKEQHGYMLCPHSAVGVSALKQLGMQNGACVALATAHEAKFPDACKRAVGEAGLPPPPPELQKLWKLKTRAQVCDNDITAVENFVRSRINERLAKNKQVMKLGSWVIGGAAVVAVLGVCAIVVTRASRK